MDASSVEQGGKKDLWLAAMPIVFVLIWATGFVSAKLAMPHAPPFSFLCWRYALSILVFGIWIAFTRPAWPQSRQQWLHLGITGVLMHAGYLGGVWAAIKLGMSAGLSALIVGLQPILTALWISARANAPGSHVTGRQWLGLVIGFIGLGLVVSNKFGTLETHFAPMAWVIFALLSITAGTLYQKAYVQPCDVRTANFSQLIGALMVSLPMAALEPQSISWQRDTYLALAWAVLGLTLGGSSLMYLLIQRGALTRVTSLLYLVPPTTAVIALLMFGEPLTLLMLCGMAVTAWGVYLVVGKK